MDNTNDSLLRTVEEILEAGMRNIEDERNTQVTLDNQRRFAAKLAIYPILEQALDLAMEAFDREYGRLFDPEYGDESSHYDAQISGLAAAIKTYLLEAGR